MTYEFLRTFFNDMRPILRLNRHGHRLSNIKVREDVIENMNKNIRLQYDEMNFSMTIHHVHEAAIFENRRK